MRFDCKNCTIIITDGKGKVYQNSCLMFKGDSYIAIKFMLQFTEDADEVKEFFKPQLSMREKVNWKKQDEKLKKQEQERIRKEQEKADKEQTRKPVFRKPRMNKMEKLFNK